MGVKWYFTVVLICIYLIFSDIAHLFMCLLAIDKSLKKMSVQVLYAFFSWVVFVVIVFMNPLYILDINPLQIYDLQVCPRILWVAFLFSR